MASHFKKKRKKKGSEPGFDYDARLHKAHSASEVKKQLVKVDDHDSWDKNGDTPLHSYIRRRDKERFNCMMTFLIHSKCDVNRTNRDGQTALHLACQVNDLTMAKALVAFDAKINSLNNSYYTPLDIVLDNHGDSDLKDLLYLVGGMTSEEKGYGGDYSDDDSGRLSPYTEIDVASRELGHQQPLLTQDYNNGRPTSISAITNGYDEADFGDDESPSPARRRQRGGISPPGGLTSLPEEGDDDDDLLFKTALPHEFMAARESSMAEDPLFMTARLDSDQDPLFMTAMTTCPLLPEDSGDDHHLKPIDPGSSTEKEHSMASTSPGTSKPVSVHSSLDIHIPYPISPTSSIENALTPLSVQALTLRGKLHHLIESAGEDSLASVYSSHEPPPFIGSEEQSSAWLKSHRQTSLPLGGTQHEEREPDRDKLMAQAYGDIYSYRGLPMTSEGSDDVDGGSPRQRRSGQRRKISPMTRPPWADSSPSESPQSESPLGQSPPGRSPLAQSPRTGSPPLAHSPPRHTQLAYYSPKVESPLVQSYSPPAPSSPSPSPRARSPRAESPRPESPRAHSPQPSSSREESPPAPSSQARTKPTPLPRTKPPQARSKPTPAPREKSPPATVSREKSPPSPAPRAKSPPPPASPKAQSPLPAPSPEAKSPRAQSPAKQLLEVQVPKVTGQSSPEHHGHGKGQHVHFEEKLDKKDHQHLSPLNLKKEGGRKKEHKKRPHLMRQPSSDGPMRSLSTFNRGMDVLTSIIGQGVVLRNPEHLIGQKILCLDGGGVKGLVQIEILKTIEQMTGKSISDLFDWVVGTSTGGILALGMIYGGLSLPELRQLYFEMKDTVFKPQFKFFNHACDTNALEELLKRMLGTEMKMDAVKKPNILITAVDKTTNRLPLVFFNNCMKPMDRKSVRNELVWKVARYTSAAPVFFAECDNYIDGGVVANNPTMHALAEIQEYLAKTHGRDSPAAKVSCVVSLGCGIYPPEPLGNTDIADALKITKMHKAPERLGQLLNLLTTALGGSEDIARLCRINCEQQSISYFRFSPEIGEEVGTTEKDNNKLCEIIIRAKALFVENAEQVKEMVKVLGCEMHEDYLYHV